MFSEGVTPENFEEKNLGDALAPPGLFFTDRS
jgi:hypothetical protein